MKSVCISVGHWQAENLTAKNLRSWRSAEILRKSTGASGERDYHWNKVMPLLKDMLIARGVQVYVTGCNWDEVYKRNFDLFLSLHYDGGGSQNRCMISSPTREAVPAFLNDKAQRESERFCAIWKSIYPTITETINRDEMITEGMLWYYAFDYVPVDTPAVIIEHFNHTSEKGKELKKKPELVAQADFKAICQFLDIPEEEPSNKYELYFKGEKIKEYDFNVMEKLFNLDRDLNSKIKECEKLGKEFEAFKLAKSKEISDLNIGHINYKTQTEKVIIELNGEVLNLETEIKGKKDIIKQLKKNPTLDLYSGIDLVLMGIAKLVKRKKSNEIKGGDENE